MRKIKDIKAYQKVIVNAGYNSFAHYFLKFALPLLIAAGLTPFIFRILFPNVRQDIGYVIIFLTAVIVFVYPFAIASRKKTSVNENLHLFITFAGTISTLQISRALLFKKIAEKDIFGEISNLSKKIRYLSKKWNLGFAITCRKVSQITPSKIFADFLDRFAVMMDFGENLDTFLLDEQTQIMNEYSTQYNKSLELIRTMQEIFLSLSIALAFGFTIALFLPLIMEIDIETLLTIFMISIIGLDVIMLLIIVSVIPKDKITHNLRYKSKETRLIRKLTIPITLLCLIIMATTIKLGITPLILDIALGLSPLFVIGYLARREEELVNRRDAQFPVFIRTLGSTIEIKNRAILTAFYSLRVHDFGLLNDMMVNLYRRLRLGCDKFQAWMYFAGESGSNLISHFSSIFSETFYLGGNAEKIGEIISKNFLKLLSLRKLRGQVVSAFRSSIYGSLIGFAAVTYIAVFITQSLSDLFSSTTGTVADKDSIMNGMLTGILPLAISIDFTMVSAYIGIIILLHSLFGSILINVVEGSHPYTLIINFLIMLWIGVIICIFAPDILSNVMPDVTPITLGN